MKEDKYYRLFPLGSVVATENATAFTTEEERTTFLWRHQIGSWEETSSEGRAENTLALYHDLRVLSEHTAHSSGNRIWIITEADRSITTILTPEEY